MAQSDAPILTTVDYDKAGKQISFLGFPCSTNESAYRTVTVPIAVIKHGSGPTVLLTAGVHGDEYEGQVALMKLARSLDPGEVQGRVIIAPCLNLPAVLARQRLSPIDGLNLNGVYPGAPDGTVTQLIAHYVNTVLLAMANVHVDLHSGGTTLEYIPCVLFYDWGNPAGDKDRERKILAAMKVFGAPVALLDRALDYTGNPALICAERGIVNLGTELGGAGIVSKQVVHIAERGVMNLLKHFGLVEGEIITPEQEGEPPSRLVEIMDPECYVMAPDDGIYEPFVELGDAIATGQAIGQVHYPADIDKAPRLVHAQRAGMLLGRRPPAGVERGDNVAIIAQVGGPVWDG